MVGDYEEWCDDIPNKNVGASTPKGGYASAYEGYETEHEHIPASSSASSSDIEDTVHIAQGGNSNTLSQPIDGDNGVSPEQRALKELTTLDPEDKVTSDINSFISGNSQDQGSQKPNQNNSEEEIGTWEELTIRQLRSSSMIRVPILLQDRPLKAVVDTAAEVTIISDRVFRELEPKPPHLKKVILHTAGRDMKMDGFVVGPVAVQLGNSIFSEAVYVAPIQDDMLLGLDFLLRHGVDIKLEDRRLHCKARNEEIPIEVERASGQENKVAHVIIEKTVTLPPNSATRLRCKISDKLADYIIEPEGDLEVAIPRTLHVAGSEPTVCMLNLTNNFIKLRRDRLVAQAFPVCSVQSIPVDDSGQIDETEFENSATIVQDTEFQGDQDESSLSEGTEVPPSTAVSSEDEKIQTDSFLDFSLGNPGPEGVNVREAKVETQSAENRGETHVIPEHLRDLFQRSTEHLNREERDQLAEVLIEYQDVFAQSEFDLGNFTEIVHAIDTGSAKPIKQRMRRTPAGFAAEEEAHLGKMLKAGVIQPSISEWASAPVLVRKRDGSVRWCVDYRALNSATKKDVFPLPLVEDCLDTLAGNKWFSKLDANSAYWQIPIREPDRQKTAFITKYGLFEHVRMGFGLCNGPSTYARVMSLVLRGLMWSIVLAFLDDILVLGSSFDDHLAHIREVLQRFRQYQLKLKPKKCVLFQRKVDFLGRLVSEEGIELSETDIKTVLDWPAPQCTREVEQFLGLANYHRNFIKDFARIAVPLYRITGKNQFTWTEAHQLAFEDLKEALTTAPVLGLPNHTDLFIVDTDASNYAIGAELIQVQEGAERVIAYGSYALTPEQINYCTTRKELLAVVRFTRQFRHYILGRQFLVRSDHSSLRWLLNFKEPDGQLARWLEELSQYDMVVRHRPGRKHENADALSR
ncbi:MAG: retroviral-like aspartic protease family protein, partial [Candidatus Thiodiazotropha taylori]|nr:retroviral-like aspartic protease family protein [Candidatus Thiodiazotropha taylori]